MRTDVVKGRWLLHFDSLLDCIVFVIYDYFKNLKNEKGIVLWIVMYGTQN